MILAMISGHFVFYYPSQFATFSFYFIKTQATLHLSFVSLLCIYVIGIWTLHDPGKGANSRFFVVWYRYHKGFGFVSLCFNNTVFTAAVNNISAISRRSVLLVEETGVPGANHLPVASYWHTLSHDVVSNAPRLKWIT
jgi:hypothetical protein